MFYCAWNSIRYIIWKITKITFKSLGHYFFHYITRYILSKIFTTLFNQIIRIVIPAHNLYIKQKKLLQLIYYQYDVDINRFPKSNLKYLITYFPT
ncbi:hypothetical protein V1478_010796 [Vespula squamosa]|uniref:Uncharacterized protein n=1 Tax=Vespula squamosa TaxID=30214 RepID=A0ABD2AFD6_VESSQ